MKDIAIYGAGGFGRETACLLREINEVAPTWNFIGFFDDGLPAGTRNHQGATLGGIDALNALDRDLALVFAIAAPKTVEGLFGKISNPRIEFPNIVAPTARILDPATLKLGRGNVISHHSSISCDVELGDFNLFFSASAPSFCRAFPSATTRRSARTACSSARRGTVPPISATPRKNLIFNLAKKNGHRRFS